MDDRPSPAAGSGDRRPRRSAAGEPTQRLGLDADRETTDCVRLLDLPDDRSGTALDLGSNGLGYGEPLADLFGGLHVEVGRVRVAVDLNERLNDRCGTGAW